MIFRGTSLPENILFSFIFSYFHKISQIFVALHGRRWYNILAKLCLFTKQQKELR